MDESDDPYQILSVPHDATPEQIKKAYRKMALKHHPDKQSNEEDRAKAGPIFVKISNAYELLSDEEERRYYDMQQGRSSSSSPKKNSSGGGGGFPSQTTYTTSSSMPSQTYTRTSKPSTHYSTNDSHFQHNFHDPFSVFESVFREEFGGGFPGSGGSDSGSGSNPKTSNTETSSGSGGDSNKTPEGGTQVSMSTAMKTINGKKVTVTERVFQMPDGSLQTRVGKQVNTTDKSRTTKSSPTSKSTPMSSPRRSISNKPTVTTKIVNGQKETTTEYPDGRVETKVEPASSSSAPVISPTKKKKHTTTFQFQTPPASPLTSKSPNSTKAHTTIKIVNGMKEITTEYPDGRVETRIERTTSTSPRKQSTTSTSSSYSPTSVQESYASPSTRSRQVVPSRPANTRETFHLSSPSSVGTGTSSSSHQTRIVNGKKETIIEHTITRPDGTMETRFEKQTVAI